MPALEWKTEKVKVTFYKQGMETSENRHIPFSAGEPPEHEITLSSLLSLPIYPLPSTCPAPLLAFSSSLHSCRANRGKQATVSALGQKGFF